MQKIPVARELLKLRDILYLKTSPVTSQRKIISRFVDNFRVGNELSADQLLRRSQPGGVFSPVASSRPRNSTLSDVFSPHRARGELDGDDYFLSGFSDTRPFPETDVTNISPKINETNPADWQEKIAEKFTDSSDS